jgi:hypothetical protein
MDCRSARLLAEFVRPAEGLPEAERQKILEQLQDCPELALEFSAQQRADAAIARAMRDVPIPADGPAKVLAKLALMRRKHARRRVALIGSAIAAVLLLAVGIGYWQVSRPAPLDLDLAGVQAAEALVPARVDAWLAKHGLPAGLPTVGNRRLDYEALRVYGIGTFREQPTPMLLLSRGHAQLQLYLVPAGRFDLTGLDQTSVAVTSRGTVEIVPTPGNRRVVVVAILTPGATLEQFCEPIPLPEA